MDLLQDCAKAYGSLLEYGYHFIIGRKGEMKEFYLNFEKSDFHHLAGLHKLKDIAQIQQGMRDKIFDKIIKGDISMDLIRKSVYFSQMSGRILPLLGLEKLLDDSKIVFRYNENIQRFSVIRADYLLEGDANTIPSYLFLGKRFSDEKEQMCRTFFRVESKDYTEGQPKFTLLKKEKRHLATGKIDVQYNRLK